MDAIARQTYSMSVSLIRSIDWPLDLRLWHSVTLDGLAKLVAGLLPSRICLFSYRVELRLFALCSALLA